MIEPTVERNSFFNRPRRESFLVFGAPEVLQPEIDEVVATLKSGWIGTGPKVVRFEQAFRQYVGTERAVAVSSCTAALHLALLALGVGPEDEVITSPMTFAATAIAILYTGAKPVFADIDRDTFNIDPARIEEAVTPRTKAIIPVHFGGRPCDMDAIRTIASRHGLYLLEDAAHALGAQYHGQAVGALGDLAAFSFYATKNVVTGEGGMITTQNQTWADRLESLRLFGLSRDAWKRFSEPGHLHYEVVEIGYKYNMTDIEASLGLHQLSRLEVNLVRRQAIWESFDAAFRDLPLILPSPAAPNTRHARHLYSVLVDTDVLGATRDQVMARLHEENIGTGVHYIALHEHPYFVQRFGYRPDDYPNARFVSERTLSMPLSTRLTDDDVADVIASVNRVLASLQS